MIEATRYTVRALIITASFITGSVFAADIEWEGWAFDYTTNENASGLVLKNVEFAGKKILNKASMPVMRVEYDADICGPYADILSSSRLQPVTTGDPASVCDGQSVCRRTFTQNGQRMLEVGSNWQIGEYQIYQTYYFSKEGYIDARVYSRGLQCHVNHRHHAHWMFDFDIGDEAHDRILRGSDDVQSVEFNDLTANTGFWTIEDTLSGDRVRLIPSEDDGAPDGFSQWDAAGRKYNASEIGLWRLGARGEIGSSYIDPPENIDGEDVVFWYVSHLPHASVEGAGIWHASGPRIQVEPGAVIPDVSPEPVVAPDPANMLTNGSFEFELAGWAGCGDADNLTISDTASMGMKSLLINGGGCLYQTVPVTVAENYTLTCDATRPGSMWSIVELSFLDSQYKALETEVLQIASGGGFAQYTMSGAAPVNSAFGLALVYSEDQTLVDNCVLAASGTPTGQSVKPDANLLVNGGFEGDLSSWSSCAAADLSGIVEEADSGSRALRVADGGCMYQEFEIISGREYLMNCRGRRDDNHQYASVSLTLMNASYATLANSELPVDSSVFTDYTASLTAPADSKFGSVVVYSEDPAVFDNCSVTVK